MLKKERICVQKILVLFFCFTLLSFHEMASAQKLKKEKEVRTFTNQDIETLKAKKKGSVTYLDSDRHRRRYNAPEGSTGASRIPAYAEWTWYEDSRGYEKAMRIAREFRIPVLLYFYTDWCGFCRTLDREYWSDARIRQGIRSFVKVKINPEHSLADKKLSRRYRVRGYPTIFVVRQDGREKRFHPFRQYQGKTQLMHPADFIRLLHEFIDMMK